MLISTVLALSAYSVIVPFMPVVCIQKGVDEVMIGSIFAVFSISVIFGSPCMGFVIQRVGRRIPIIGGCYVLAIGFEILAFITSFESKEWFIALSFVARILQGFGFATI
jgi:MFS family permease